MFGHRFHLSSMYGRREVRHVLGMIHRKQVDCWATQNWLTGQETLPVEEETIQDGHQSPGFKQRSRRPPRSGDSAARRGPTLRPRVLGGRPTQRALRPDALRVPRALEPEDQRVPGRGRILVRDDGRRRPHGQPRLADLLLRLRDHGADQRDPAARADPGHVHRHGSAQARSAQGSVPARLHAEADRRARGRDPRDRSRRPRRDRGKGDGRARQRGRAAVRLARDRQLHGHPEGRGRDLGPLDELDPRRQRSRHQPRGRPRGDGAGRPRDVRTLLEADRRAPREPDRRPDQRPRPRRGRRRAARGARDRDGLLPAHGRRQRQHQGDLLQRDAGADGGPDPEAAAARRPGAGRAAPSRRPCGCSPRSPTSAAPRRRTPS